MCDSEDTEVPERDEMSRADSGTRGLEGSEALPLTAPNKYT